MLHIICGRFFDKYLNSYMAKYFWKIIDLMLGPEMKYCIYDSPFIVRFKYCVGKLIKAANASSFAIRSGRQTCYRESLILLYISRTWSAVGVSAHARISKWPQNRTTLKVVMTWNSSIPAIIFISSLANPALSSFVPRYSSFLTSAIPELFCKEHFTEWTLLPLLVRAGNTIWWNLIPPSNLGRNSFFKIVAF